MNCLFYFVPVASVIALFFAWLFYHQMKKESEGTPTMKEIAQYVREGAMAYLKQQYKVVGIVFIILAVLFSVLAFGFGVQNKWVPFAFLTGGFFSALAGYVGMRTATYAFSKSLNSGLKLAFRSGAVMGLTVVGLGLLDISIWWVILNAFVHEASESQTLVVITTTMLTFGMGASTQALFARVGGGIHTKGADVGAERGNRIFLRTTQETLPHSLTTWVTTWVMSPEWVRIFTSLIADPSSPQWLLAPPRSLVTWMPR